MPLDASNQASSPPPQSQRQRPQEYGVSIFSHSAIAKFAARMPQSSVNSFCGAVAGVASGIVTCPLDVIKTKLQAQSAFRPRGAKPLLSPYHGLIGTASTIWRQDGVRGMYRGLGPMLVGYLPTWSVYMSVYGAAKDYFYTQMENQWLAQVLASITAGGCSTIVTNPIWVVKTRLMSQVGSAAAKDTRTPWFYKSTVDAFRQMYAAEGLAAFYSGLAPALLGLTHVAIQFPLYEYFKLKFTGKQMGEYTTGEDHTVAILGATFLSKICATSATYPHEVLRTRLQTQQRQPLINTLRGGREKPKPDSPPDKGRVSPEHRWSLPRYHGILMTCKTILREEGWRAFYFGMGTNMIRAVPSAMTTMVTFETLKKGILRLQEEGRET